jgi:hypothetical protein
MYKCILPRTYSNRKTVSNFSPWTNCPDYRFADIKGETERTFVTAKIWAKSTNYFKRTFLKAGIESRCQL